MRTDGSHEPTSNYASINGLDLYYDQRRPLRPDPDPRRLSQDLAHARRMGPPYHGIMTRTHLLVPIISEFLEG